MVKGILSIDGGRAQPSDSDAGGTAVAVTNGGAVAPKSAANGAKGDRPKPVARATDRGGFRRR